MDAHTLTYSTASSEATVWLLLGPRQEKRVRRYRRYSIFSRPFNYKMASTAMIISMAFIVIVCIITDVAHGLVGLLQRSSSHGAPSIKHMTRHRAVSRPIIRQHHVLSMATAVNVDFQGSVTSATTPKPKFDRQSWVKVRVILKQVYLPLDHGVRVS